LWGVWLAAGVVYMLARKHLDAAGVMVGVFTSMELSATILVVGLARISVSPGRDLA
jgi:hypothetical protein